MFVFPTDPELAKENDTSEEEIAKARWLRYFFDNSYFAQVSQGKRDLHEAYDFAQGRAACVIVKMQMEDHASDDEIVTALYPDLVAELQEQARHNLRQN